MDNFSERRKYQRCSSTICKALMSIDGKRWSEIELCDISAGGLRFYSKSIFTTQTPVEFNLNVYNMLSEFNMRMEGHVIKVTEEKNKPEYSVKFDNINKYTQVQLDELIKSKVTINNQSLPAPEDGSYTFMFFPRIRTHRIKNKMRMLR